MKKIMLNLSDATANQFNKLSPQERKTVEMALTNVLEDIVRKKTINQLFQAMDNMSAEAQKNGLTIAKLAEIMEWDEEEVKNLFGEEAISNEP